MEQWPKCLACDSGVLIPLSDYGREGATIKYKAWVCTNSKCGFHLRIDNGEISIGDISALGNANANLKKRM